MVVIMLLSSSRDVDNVWARIGKLIMLWPMIVIVLSALKGLTYILGLAEKHRKK